jgi:hypothetical protein
MIEHTPAVPGAAHVLWRDGDAELRVTLLEVQHFRQSAANVFTFAAGAEEPARVVCLFDFGSFYPPDSPQARAGGRPDNPHFQRPDLLVAEATTWADQRQTVGRPGAHLAFERLAEYLSAWSPLQTRVVHYAGFEDMCGAGGPAEYREKVERGLHLHPREGPVAEWEMNAAMQEHLHAMGYPRPRSVCLGRPSEALVVFPRVEKR